MSTAFSRIFSSLRRERGLSQRKVAEDLNISQALLSHYENGLREPKFEFIIKVCEYYGVTADYLLGRSKMSEDFSKYFAPLSVESSERLSLVIAACAEIFEKDALTGESFGEKYISAAALKGLISLKLVPEEDFSEMGISRAYGEKRCGAAEALFNAELERYPADEGEKDKAAGKLFSDVKEEIF